MLYATSDLHGCSPKTLQYLLNQAGFSDDDFLFVLGDVIDRGEQGAELLLWLTQQPNVQLILGNHEALMLACSFLFEEVNADSLDALTPERLELVENWLMNGGKPTLDGLRKLLHRDPELVQGILEYLREAPLYEWAEAGGQTFLLVHAGLGNYRPGKKMEDYTPEELLLHRPALTDRYMPGVTVIFGHTPTEYYGEIYRRRMVRTESWRCIDTGAAMGYFPMLLRLDDGKAFYI